MKPVPSGHTPTDNIPYLERYESPLVDRHNPVNRSCKTQIRLAPSHRFREGDTRDNTREHFSQYVSCVTTLLALVNRHIRPLTRFHNRKFLYPYAFTLGESHRCFRRVSIGIERHLLRRSEPLQLFRPLPLLRKAEFRRSFTRDSVGCIC